MERCPVCPARFSVIPGDGPQPCRVAMVGQNPGKTEEAQAAKGMIPRVFVGDAGRELWEHYCPIAGLVRNDDVYISNVVKCHTENDRKPSPKEIDGCSRFHLAKELEDCNPEIVVLMGSPACSIVPEIKLDVHHGYPKKVQLFGKSRWVFPVNHPASGLHSTSMITILMQDFERLGKVLRGDFSFPVDQHPNPHYEDLTHNHEKLHAVLKAGMMGRRPAGILPLMARDTETLSAPDDRHIIPFCSTFSVDDKSGYMVRVVDKEGLAILGSYLHYYYGILHNDLFDLSVEETMGLPYCDYADTMRLAYHQADLPLRLKSLAWRLCGISMKDYSDVVMPYSRDAVLEWLEAAFDIADTIKGTKLIPKKRKIPKTDKAFMKLVEELKDHRTYDLDGYMHYTISQECDSPLSKKILHIYNHTSKPVPEESTPYNPWEAWKKQTEKFEPEQLHMITSRIGNMPKASIEQVYKRNPQASIDYACADSRGTFCIYPELLKRAEKYHGRIMPGDID